jgi:S-DNA-T family DNA segregation ATPase FtsK/SpoIIIE
VRKAAAQKYADWFEQNDAEMGEIFDRLTKIRHQMGVNMGFKNFIPLGYMNQGRMDYNEKDVAAFRQQVLEEIEKKAQQTGSKKPATASDPDPSDEELEGDEMLPAAVDVILETGQASVSMLQRRLKLGYARAARIVDEMEEKGIVGPFQGSKPRAILITKEQWQARKNGQGEQMEFDDLGDYGVPEEL